MIKKILKSIAISAMALTVIISHTACKSNETNETAGDPVSKTEFHLNTSCTIEIRNMETSKANDVIAKAFKECEKYENLLSRTVEGSDIYKINHSDGKPVKVSDDAKYLIEESKKISEQTSGIFDSTIGKIEELWNFTGDNPKVPPQGDIQKALTQVGYKNVKVDGNTVTLENKRPFLDLGASAKGYIADRLYDFLKKEGVKSAIINLGGNVVAIGGKEGDKDWKIGIESPYSKKQNVIGAVSVKDKTIVTSGTYERYFEEKGKKYHHILDPQTGFPRNTDVLSVSIMAKSGKSVTCDLYSTTCLLLGKEKAIEFMKDKKGFEYCIVDNNQKITKSPGFNLSQQSE